MSALLDKVRQTLRQRNYSYRTEESYLYWIRKHIFLFDYRRKFRVQTLVCGLAKSSKLKFELVSCNCGSFR